MYPSKQRFPLDHPNRIGLCVPSKVKSSGKSAKAAFSQKEPDATRSGQRRLASELRPCGEWRPARPPLGLSRVDFRSYAVGHSIPEEMVHDCGEALKGWLKG